MLLNQEALSCECVGGEIAPSGDRIPLKDRWKTFIQSDGKFAKRAQRFRSSIFEGVIMELGIDKLLSEERIS